MDQTDLNLIRSHIKKSYRIFTAAVAMITLLELILTIRGLHIFDFERTKHRMYLYSYLFLFFFSLTTCIVLLACRARERYMSMIIGQTYLYAFCLICWATLVSSIDCIARGDSGPMVYVMVCFAVSVLFLIKPIYYITMLALSTVMLLSICYSVSGAWFSTGFYLNFAVFLAQAIFISAHTYRLNRREFEAEENLIVLSQTDQLTGLYNRRRLDEQIIAQTAGGEPYLFVLIDVDDFKQVNDMHGHAVGDDCLILIASHLRTCFGDMVYRFGGDEFAVISTETSAVVCDGIDRVNATLRTAFEQIDLHISAGIYQTREEDTSGTVFVCADRALYDAKHRGKAGWVLYDKDGTTMYSV